MDNRRRPFLSAHMPYGRANSMQPPSRRLHQIPANKSLFGSQSGTPDWKTKPSWYIISKSDKAINPDLERFCAKRAGAKVTEIESSHVVMRSHPKEVLTVIKEAAAAAK